MFQRKSRCLWATLLALPWAAIGQTYSISTFAGGGLPVNISAVSASLYGPDAVAVDKYGNVFFTDMQTVLRLDAATGILTLVAGNGAYGFSGDNGPSTAAVLNSPAGIAVDSAGNLYIADSSNQRVRKVTNGVITTVAGGGVCCSPGDGDGGPATSAVLNNPAGLAVDAAGNLYIAEPASNRIREVSNGIITLVAGNGTVGPFGDGGPATSASLYLQDYEGGIAVDSAGNLYIVDSGDDLIRKVADGIITTVAGNGMKGFGGDNGPATSASLNLQEYGAGVVVNSSGNLYIADSGNYRIRKVSAGVITTVAGNGAPGFAGDSEAAVGAELNLPQGIAVDTAGNLYIADYGNQRVRKVSGGTIATVAGNGTHGSGGNNGPATGAELYRPSGVALDGAGNLYIADTINNCVRKVAGGVVTTVAGNGTQGFSGDDGPAALAQLNQPYGVAVDFAGNLYIADSLNNRIREVSGGVITTVAGNGSDITGGGDNGSALSAVLAGPRAVAVDAGANLYIADTVHDRIRKVSNGVITTVAGLQTPGFAGDNGPATNALLNSPGGIALDASGNLYIADTGNDSIRKVTDGIITTVAGYGLAGAGCRSGNATAVGLRQPDGVAVDSAGNIFIADAGNNCIRRVSGGMIATVAGNGLLPGFSGDGGPATSAQLYLYGYLNDTDGLAVDALGRVFVADAINNRIRELTPSAGPTITPNGVVPIDSTVPVIQPGSWVSIYGSNLASGTYLWNADFPTSLGDVTVTINNKPAYLWLASPTQINLQAPDDSTLGPVNVVVNTAMGTATSTVALAPYGPSFSLLGDGKHAAGEIATPGGTGAYGGGTYDLDGPPGTFSFNTRPVKPGETLILYGVGFGPTNPTVTPGQVFSGAAATGKPVTITIGGVPANVAFAGITEAGLYQFNLIVPSNTGSGDQALLASISGIQTPPGAVVTIQ